MKGRNKDKLCDVCVIIVPSYSYDDLIDKVMDQISVAYSDDGNFRGLVYSKAVNILRHDTKVVFPKAGKMSWHLWTQKNRHSVHIYRDLKLKVLWDLQQAYGVNHSMKREFKRQIKDTKAIDVGSEFAYN